MTDYTHIAIANREKKIIFFPAFIVRSGNKIINEDILMFFENPMGVQQMASLSQNSILDYIPVHFKKGYRLATKAEVEARAKELKMDIKDLINKIRCE